MFFILIDLFYPIFKNSLFATMYRLVGGMGEPYACVFQDPGYFRDTRGSEQEMCTVLVTKGFGLRSGEFRPSSRLGMILRATNTLHP